MTNRQSASREDGIASGWPGSDMLQIPVNDIGIEIVDLGAFGRPAVKDGLARVVSQLLRFEGA